MKRHHANTTLIYQEGISSFIKRGPGAIMRVKWRKGLLAVSIFLILAVLFRVNMHQKNAISRGTIVGFQDLQKTDTASHADILPRLEMYENSNIYARVNKSLPVPPKDIPEIDKTDESTVKELIVSDNINPKQEKNKRVPTGILREINDVLAMSPPKLLPNYKNPCWYEKNETTTRLRCLPYFHLMGVCKSGTTDLWFRIAQHPELVRPNGVMGKETHWWSWRRFGFDLWTRNAGKIRYDQYLDVFDKAAYKIESWTETRGNITNYHPVITGEGSPTVFWDFTGWDQIPQNYDRDEETAFLTPHCIKHLTPDAKFIVLFRNPTERLYSGYLFLDRFRSFQNASAESFHYSVIKSIKMFKECLIQHTLKSCLFNKTLHIYIPVRLFTGMYVVYLKEWLKVFPEENILILRTEDYSKDIFHHLEKVYDFLGLRKLPSEQLQKIANLDRAFTRSGKDKASGQMWSQTRTILNEFYQSFNQELSTFLKDNRFLWT